MVLTRPLSHEHGAMARLLSGDLAVARAHGASPAAILVEVHESTPAPSTTMQESRCKRGGDGGGPTCEHGGGGERWEAGELHVGAA